MKFWRGLPIFTKANSRKKIKVFIKHPTEPAQEKWDLEVSDHRKFLKDMFPDYNIKFKELDTEEEDIAIILPGKCKF